MLRQEIITLNDRKLVKTWSDNNKYIIQVGTGVKYIQAIDILNKHAYIESLEVIPVEEKLEMDNEK